MDNRSKLKNAIVAGIIGMTVLSGIPFKGEATPLTEGDYSERMDALDSKEEEAEQKLKEIAEKIEATEKEAEEFVQQLQETTDELEAIQKEISTVSKQIEQREEQLQSQIRAMQVNGQSGNVLRFILDSESLGDAFGRIDVVNTLFSANQNLMEKQIEDKELIAANERLTIKKQEEQTLLAANLENSKVQLEENQAEQEMMMAAIAAERSQVREEREAFLAQQRESQRRLEEIQTSRTAAESAAPVNVSQATEEDQVSTSSSSKPAEEKAEPAASGGVVSNAHSLTGSRYSYGGTTPAGFDCSGYTQFVFRRAGRSIPRSAAAQFGASRRVSLSEAQPGDLIFFNQSGSVDHVGIYLGGGRFIGAQSSTGVAVASFTSGYWSNYVAGFGRP
ncbi:C40 family peptidase [Alkalibacterium thalassium]|uniref:Cell wall-associated hydrolase, NlpC family n=1 Tax=Alkalibacterium thalassium TaxID=426701 RepID=A0A1G8XDA6_9LACT|nr:C40 family peptidase [Alkalibacterium thalassium]SDJ88542.1 Cell wall-associated hydrolase, NlpC family [Alkalibacterium thalassium]